MIIEAKVLNAISQTMTCDKCPYQCVAKEKSSQANCVSQWARVSSYLNTKCDWKEVKYIVSLYQTKSRKE